LGLGNTSTLKEKMQDESVSHRLAVSNLAKHDFISICNPQALIKAEKGFMGAPQMLGIKFVERPDAFRPIRFASHTHSDKMINPK
jgi:hypothetical protein